MSILAVLGYDFGGVICAGNLFEDQYLDAEPVEGAFEAIQEMVELYGPKNNYIISKAKSQKIISRSIEWLNFQRFCECTGMFASHVMFCDDRMAKTAIANLYGLNAFVDDRADVLIPMQSVATRIWFAPDEFNRHRFRELSGGIIQAQTWAQVALHLRVH